MKEEEIKIDFEQLKKDKEQNVKDRKWFIDYWVEYIKTHSDEEWGEQHTLLINSQIF